MKHELKIHPQHWWRVMLGTKTFEIRVNDRFFQKGDMVLLKPWCPNEKQFLTTQGYCDLGRKIGDVYAIDSERVVFSLLDTDFDTKQEEENT